MPEQRRQRKGDQEQGPFVGAEDRPDLTIDLDAKVGDMTVRELSTILGTNVGLAPGSPGIIWKVPKDLKDIYKDHKDIKDIVDTGSPILKEIFEVQKPREGMPTPDWGQIATGSPLDALIERISGLEREVAKLRGE